MIEDQMRQHPVRLPPDKHTQVDVTVAKFENDPCKEPLLSEKQTSHRVTPMDARSTVANAVTSTTSINGDTTTNMVTVTGVGIGTNANAWMDTTVVGVNNVDVTNTAAGESTDDKPVEEDCVQVPIFDEGTTDSGRLPDVVAESNIYGVNEDEPLESYLAITIQVFIPFLIAGLGMVGAGLVLDLVQHWVVFEKVSELIILVPALLGLKGNLEMTLASRLSTQANLGHMDTPKQQWYMIVGNLVLIQDWLAPLVIACYVLVTPLWVWIAKRNKYTNDVLYSGWTPVMIAMLISSCGGLILEFMVSRFENLTVFQPVINGVGGNLVAVQASRISTALHKQAELGTLLIPPGHTHPVIFITPIANFFGKGTHARTTRVLMAMVIPGHIIFIYLINYMKDGNTSLTPLFVFVYLCAAMLQVAALLYIAYIMIHWMWKRKIDPDNSAIPYLTAMGDLLGISLLAIAFQFLYLVGDQDFERAIAP
ncbi:unnamed protein product [Xylocopa violacea]|uniref:SLC41A/MgtE integral membrane domain-containing protein n=1 Tax=Xylocopa violacea TaxID=135666 RepID=A0ABP1N8L0_XYLVO